MNVRNIKGTQEERDLIQSIKSKPLRLLGVLRDGDIPLPCGILEHLKLGEWIWKLEPETEGKWPGMYGGIWITGNPYTEEYNLLVMASPRVYDTYIKSQVK